MVGLQLRGALPIRIALGRREVPTEVAVPEFAGSASSSPSPARAGGLGGRLASSERELDRFLDWREVLRPVLTCSASYHGGLPLWLLT